MTLRLLVLALLACALFAPVAEARSKSCTRGGATLEAADGNVRIVRRELKLRMQETRREAVMACWAPTGRRRTVIVEQDVGLDLITRTDLEIVDGRYVGVVADFEGGVSESVSAAVWDARTRKRLHTAKACDDNEADFGGPEDVVFLPRGGMAFACGRLLLFRRGSTKTAQQLEPPEADVRQLGLSLRARGFGPRLYWTLGDGTLKALDL